MSSGQGGVLAINDLSTCKVVSQVVRTLESPPVRPGPSLVGNFPSFQHDISRTILIWGRGPLFQSSDTQREKGPCVSSEYLHSYQNGYHWASDIACGIFRGVGPTTFRTTQK